MPKIVCPHCHQEIELGKDAYNSLLNDISKEELEKRVRERIEDIESRIKAQYELQSQQIKNNQDAKIKELEAKNSLLNEKLNGNKKDIDLAVNSATSDLKDELAKKNEEIAQLKGDIKNINNSSELEKKQLQEKFDFDLKAKDDEIKHWKEYRMGDSTKDIGESLEQYCHDKFDEIRTYAYPNAYFEKDNEVVGGTKGDFIFKDYSDDDLENEIVSIMFEMKNQKEDGDTKNESHLKKLDSDRVKKKCEYAVLVSTLEPESNLYNSGIVDVSYRYEKMFVVRPQFFLTIIGLIKNMAKTRFEYKRQVIQYQKENLDITNFENAVRVVAQKINDDYENASKQYDKVEKMCDDMIKKLTDFKEAFRLGQKWIGVAQNQLPELEIRKLTKNNPTMKEKFDSLNNKEEK